MINYCDELFQTPEIITRILSDDIPRFSQIEFPVVFCGCGTSYYIGGQIARLCRAKGKEVYAVDAVDLLDGTCMVQIPGTYVFISRSGNSRETVLAMLKVRESGGDTVYLGCEEMSFLNRECGRRVLLPYAQEKNVLESFSFYAQFLAGCICCGLETERNIADMVSSALVRSRDCYESYCKVGRIARIICIGPSYYAPLLREMMLKNGEITLLPTESWNCLEFRHGPRAWADESTLIEFIPGVFTKEWDLNVAKELISYGSPMLLLSGETLPGAYSLDVKPERGSVTEILVYAAFITGLATQIGRSLGTCPENLKHVVHHVGEL